MWKTLVAVLLVVLLSNVPTARTDTLSVVVVSSCGAQTLTPGQFFPLYMDTTGTLCASGGSGGGGTVAIPYSYTAMAGAQFNQPATASTALAIPTGAKFARICAVAGQMNFVDSTNGTPTTGATPTVGVLLPTNACVFEQGATLLAAFKIINAVASTGVWNAVYFQ